MTAVASGATQRNFASGQVTRLSAVMLLLLGGAGFAALAFGEAVVAAFGAVPGADWLLIVAGSNDAILRDANMAWHGQVIAAFRLLALTTGLPMVVPFFLTLLRARPKPPLDLGGKLLWYVPLALVALWYGLFFDNVFFLSYDEFYAPPEPFFDSRKGRIVPFLLVGVATMVGLFLLPLLAAVATRLVRFALVRRRTRSP